MLFTNRMVRDMLRDINCIPDQGLVDMVRDDLNRDQIYNEIARAHTNYGRMLYIDFLRVLEEKVDIALRALTIEKARLGEPIRRLRIHE